jgi:hypothetical protein
MNVAEMTRGICSSAEGIRCETHRHLLLPVLVRHWFTDHG